MAIPPSTGLNPSAGDEIILVSAIRIVNGRLLREEIFDQLVDPQRSLPPESTDIHGISGARHLQHPVWPKIWQVCLRFRPISTSEVPCTCQLRNSYELRSWQVILRRNDGRIEDTQIPTMAVCKHNSQEFCRHTVSELILRLE